MWSHQMSNSCNIAPYRSKYLGTRGTFLQALWNITIISLLVLGFSSNASVKVTVGFIFNVCVSWFTTFIFYNQTLKTKVIFKVNLVNNESKEKLLILRRDFFFFKTIFYFLTRWSVNKTRSACGPTWTCVRSETSTFCSCGTCRPTKPLWKRDERGRSFNNSVGDFLPVTQNEKTLLTSCVRFTEKRQFDCLREKLTIRRRFNEALTN